MSTAAIDQIVSTFATLPPTEQQQVIAKLGSLMAAHPRAPTNSPCSDEELQRRMKEPASTLTEIWGRIDAK